LEKAKDELPSRERVILRLRSGQAAEARRARRRWLLGTHRAWFAGMSDDFTIREARPDELRALTPLLLLAEPSLSALRWSLENLSDTVYRMGALGALVGAATVRWEHEPAEIVELAVAEESQGRGLGRRFVLWLLDEAVRRGKRAVEVGASNASIGNIAFYQKCGFRMERVRKDYFWYDRSGRVENGIAVRICLFRWEDNARQREKPDARGKVEASR
jgi:ribosomal protein S18 acetylase RimI-like enzyme